MPWGAEILAGDFLRACVAGGGRVVAGGKCVLRAAGAGAGKARGARRCVRAAVWDQFVYGAGVLAARDAAGGHLPVAFIPYATARPFLESGKLKIIFGFSPGDSNILPKGETDLKKRLPSWKQSELFFVGLPPGTDQKIVSTWGAIYKEYLGLKETEEYFHKNFMSKDVGGPKYVAEVIALQAASFKKYNVEVK